MEEISYGPESVPKYLSKPRVIDHSGQEFLATEKRYADGVRVWIEHGTIETKFPNGDVVYDDDGRGIVDVEENESS